MIKRSFHISRSFAGTLIGLGVVALEKYLETNFFTCPCEWGYFKIIYICMFFLLPLVTLYIVGLSINPFFWKHITGCKNNAPGLDQLKLEKRVKRISPYLFAFLGPIVWLVVFLADGNYLACAVTPKPYQLQLNQTCKDTGLQIQDLSFTLRYRQIKRYSQIAGISFGFVLAISVWIWYTCNKYRSKMNYYQEKYNSKCSDQIEVLLVQEFVQKAVQKNPETKENHLQNVIDKLHKNNENSSNIWKHVLDDIGFGKTDFTSQSLNWIADDQIPGPSQGTGHTPAQGTRSASSQNTRHTSDQNKVEMTTLNENNEIENPHEDATTNIM